MHAGRSSREKSVSGTVRLSVCPSVKRVNSDSFHTNFVADCLQASAILHGKRPFCVFEPPLRRGGGLGET